MPDRSPLFDYLIPILGVGAGSGMLKLSYRELWERMKSGQKVPASPSERGWPETHRADEPWRVVLPAKCSQPGLTPEAIWQNLFPLIDRRSPDLKRAEDHLTFRPEGNPADERVILDWLRTQNGKLNSRHRLLLAGPVPDLPFSLQTALAVEGHMVGRLSLDSPADYAAYAEKVLRMEAEAAPARARTVSFFGPASDSDTQMCREAVTDPLLAHTKQNHSAHIDPDAVPMQSLDELLKNVCREPGDAPQLLFVASHGLDSTFEEMGAPCDGARRPWTAQSVLGLAGPVLPGGIAVLHGCYTAGVTGAEDPMPIPRSGFPAQNGKDRMARLPGALLTHPQGPLAVVAHVNPVIIGLHELGDPLNPRITGMSSLIDDLLEHRSVGFALERVRSLSLRALLSYKHELENNVISPDEFNEALFVPLARAGLQWQDLKGWYVLGDPSVSLRGPGRADDVLRDGGTARDEGAVRDRRTAADGEVFREGGAVRDGEVFRDGSTATERSATRGGGTR